MSLFTCFLFKIFSGFQMCEAFVWRWDYRYKYPGQRYDFKQVLKMSGNDVFNDKYTLPQVVLTWLRSCLDLTHFNNVPLKGAIVILEPRPQWGLPSGTGQPEWTFYSLM